MRERDHEISSSRQKDRSSPHPLLSTFYYPYPYPYFLLGPLSIHRHQFLGPRPGGGSSRGTEKGSEFGVKVKEVEDVEEEGCEEFSGL
jgi:hypothetical protein